MSRRGLRHAVEALRAQCDRLAIQLYAVDSHPTHDYLRRTAVTGATQRWWREGAARLDAAWAGFSQLRELVERMGTRLDGAWRPTRADLTDLARQLRQPALTVAGAHGPGPDQVTPTVLAERLAVDCADLLAGLDALSAALDRWATRIGPLRAALDAARTRLVDLRLTGDPEDPAAVLEQLATRLDQLSATGLADPIGTDPDAATVEALTGELRQLDDRLAALAELRAGLPTLLAELERAVDELDTTEAAVRQAYVLAERKIRDPRLPPAIEATPALRQRLHQVRQLHQVAAGEAGGWLRSARAGAALAADIRRAMTGALDRRAFAVGLLDRRDELRGRLSAYQVLAANHGRSEDPAVTELYHHARELLWTAPCDLPAATRAVAAYQRALSEGRMS